MSNAYTLERKLKRGMSKIVMRNPFFSMILLGQKIVYTDEVPTMGVNGETLFVNLDFVEKITPDEVIGVLVHECMHLCWNHVTRCGNRDPKLWNASCVTGTTQVLLANMSKRAIIDIRPGDYIYSPNGPNKVLGLAFNGFKSVGLLNNTLECTNDHRILTDDGFKSALYFNKGHKNLYAMSENETSSIRQPQRDESQTTGTHDRNKIQNNSRIPKTKGTKSRPLCSQTNEHGTLNVFKFTAIRLYRWYIRRRRYFFNKRKETQQRKNLSASLYNNNKHFFLHAGILPETRVLWDREDKQFREQVLEHPTIRLQSTRFSSSSRTYTDSKTSSLSMSDRALQTTQTAKEKRPSDADYVDYCNRSKKIKLEKGFFQERKTNIQPVFDLITEQGVYIANDIVIHNCDYTINPIVKEEGFFLPTPHLDEERFHHMTANEIYKILEKEQPEIDSNLLDIKPDPKQSKADRKRIEQKAKVNLAKAMQVAGDKAPAVIREMFEGQAEAVAPWETLLREFMQATLGNEDSTWRRPHRNHIHDDIYLPSSEGHQLPRLAVMIDTSGSIYSNKELFNSFATEINSIIQDLIPEQVDIYYVDTSIQKHDVYEEGESPVYDMVGGGGTDFTQFFAEVEEFNPACIIVFTDMYANGMPTIFSTDILWCCYKNDSPNTNVHGKIIQLD